jgi:hypothetical protein
LKKLKGPRPLQVALLNKKTRGNTGSQGNKKQKKEELRLKQADQQTDHLQETKKEFH